MKGTILRYANSFVSIGCTNVNHLEIESEREVRVGLAGVRIPIFREAHEAVRKYIEREWYGLLVDVEIVDWEAGADATASRGIITDHDGRVLNDELLRFAHKTAIIPTVVVD
jgi:hypothetical protein